MRHQYLIGAALSALWTGGAAAQIDVQNATYGGNCGAISGNQTSTLAVACSASFDCYYTIDYQVIGDPAYGCSKDYDAYYKCSPNEPARHVNVAAEAGFGGVAHLSCAQLKFPVKHNRTDQINGDYHYYMTTDVTVSSNGRIDWLTTLASTYWLQGFTGGQVIVITDANDNVLWTTQPESYGHGGTWVNGGPRVIPKFDQLPPTVMSQAAKIAIVHFHAPNNRLIADLTAGAKIAAAVIPILAALF